MYSYPSLSPVGRPIGETNITYGGNPYEMTNSCLQPRLRRLGSMILAPSVRMHSFSKSASIISMDVELTASIATAGLISSTAQ